jgi:glycine oxidase
VYLVPRRDGRLLVGATMEERGFDRSRPARGVELLLHRARQVAPELSDCELIDHWSGLRPQSADGLPILGRSETDGLWIASGHFRNGVLLTPITARLLADAMLRGAPIPTAFSPSRRPTP